MLLEMKVAVVLFVVLIGATNGLENCPANFVSIKGRCYYFHSEEIGSWYKALKKCRSLDSRSSLVALETRKEWSALMKYLTENNMDNTMWWIGGTDLRKEGTWRWAATKRSMKFSDWCRGEPNDYLGNEDCAVIASPSNGFNRELRYCWNDLPCKWKNDRGLSLHFICEIQKN